MYKNEKKKYRVMLFQIMKDRDAVNLLKALSDSNSVNRRSLEVTEHTLQNLNAAELIYYDDIDNNVSISIKGKEFLATIDGLKDILKDENVGVKVEVNLKSAEISSLKKIAKAGTLTIKKLSNVDKTLVDLRLVSYNEKRLELTAFGQKTLKEELLAEFNLI